MYHLRYFHGGGYGGHKNTGQQTREKRSFHNLLRKKVFLCELYQIFFVKAIYHFYADDVGNFCTA